MRDVFRHFFGLICGLLMAAVPTETRAQMTLIPSGATWRYDATGTDLGQAWKSNTFSAAAWLSGPAPLGYGHGRERTVIAPAGETRPITVYFRNEFVLPSPPFGISSILLRLACDDGAIVYLNGVEVYRRNMPIGPVNFQTPAAKSVEGAAETNFTHYAVSISNLRAMTNLLAVELHQHDDGLTDGRFDLELLANMPLSYPEIRLVSPTNGAVLNPGAVTFQVEVSDVDGYVYWVQYRINGEPIGEGYDEPFDYVWESPPAGRYRLTAEAYDNSGRRQEAAPVYFQVGDVTATRLIRGPYLQSCTTTSIVVRWRTDWPDDSAVYYDESPFNLDYVAHGPSGVDHEVKITGLQPETTYYYGLGGKQGLISEAAGFDFTFTTATERAVPLRIWAIGDSGTRNAAAAFVRDIYLDVPGFTDVWLMLGDNAYESGTDDEYQRAVFDMYPSILRNTVVWPTLGNHDAGSKGVYESFPYLEIFTLPRQGEAGGVASGTELYYSFDEGNVHFVCLDAQSSDRTPGSPMLTWLESDLAATSKDWIIAYWHHPPYTWGTHNSDTEIELIQMRQHVAPILEQYGVDLVLSGHSHAYERSYLLNGHYGYSSTLTPSMILDDGDGHPVVAPYRRPAGGLGADQGTVYVVCGCSGEGGVFPFRRHPAMANNLSGFGSMVIDVNNLRMDVRFLSGPGTFGDWFAIDKSLGDLSVRPKLDIRPVTGGVELSWPTSSRTFQLEARPTVGPGSAWDAAPGVPEIFGRRYRWRQTPFGTNRIFRLREPQP